jgi:hypothetical protein
MEHHKEGIGIEFLATDQWSRFGGHLGNGKRPSETLLPQSIEKLGIAFLQVVDVTMRNIIPCLRSASPQSRPGKAVSIHQNLKVLKIDGPVFSGQNRWIVFDARSPIVSTGIGEVKQLHIIFIRFIPNFYYSDKNIQLPKWAVIPATRRRTDRLVATFRHWLPNSFRPVMEIKIVFSGDCLQHCVVGI